MAVDVGVVGERAVAVEDVGDRARAARELRVGELVVRRVEARVEDEHGDARAVGARRVRAVDRAVEPVGAPRVRELRDGDVGVLAAHRRERAHAREERGAHVLDGEASQRAAEVPARVHADRRELAVRGVQRDVRADGEDEAVLLVVLEPAALLRRRPVRGEAAAGQAHRAGEQREAEARLHQRRRRGRLPRGASSSPRA